MGAVRHIQLARFHSWRPQKPIPISLWATNPSNVIHKSRNRGLHQCTASRLPDAMEKSLRRR